MLNYLKVSFFSEIKITFNFNDICRKIKDKFRKFVSYQNFEAYGSDRSV